MKIIESLEGRRTYYNINKELPVEEMEVFDLVKKATELVPDAFNMKSSRVVVVTGEKQNELWDNIFDVFEGNIKREKIDSFKNGYGTILYFYDEEVVKGVQDRFPKYADNFPVWASQSAGMLQISIWSGLKELGIGASLQHYNPVIDEMVKKMFGLPKSYILNAEIPFGGIVSQPDEKAKEDITERVQIIK
ncbi:MAG: nitroreductase family protein [Peptostreptococcaceae bacterium]|nr:nitroreductase family protein [Peptostreptococcaceae bacterium]